MFGSQKSTFSATSTLGLLGRHLQINDSERYDYLRNSASYTASQSDAGDSTGGNFTSQDSNNLEEDLSVTADGPAEHQTQNPTNLFGGQMFLWLGATLSLGLSGVSALAHQLTKETKWELASYTFLLLAEIYALVLPTIQSCDSVLKRRVCFLFLNFLSLLLCPTAWIFWHFGLDPWTHLCMRTSQIILTFAVVHLAVAASKNPTSKNLNVEGEMDQVFDYPNTRVKVLSSAQLVDWVETQHRHEDLAVQLSFTMPATLQGQVLVDIDLE